MLPLVLGLLLSSKPLPVDGPPVCGAGVGVTKLERAPREQHRRPVSRPWARWLTRARAGRGVRR